MTREELDKWLEQYSDEDKYNITWWKLTDILYTRIQRDKEWFYEKLPIMETFWNNVVYYRKHGNEELKPKPRKKNVARLGLSRSEVCLMQLCICPPRMQLCILPPRWP